MEITNFLTLPDQRQLAYAEYGDPQGYPVFYFHGSPSCRLEPLVLGNENIKQAGMRLIAPDRPGLGQSDFQPHRGFSDWVNDIECLANALNLDKFSVLGMSGGSGYVAVCAAKMPERLYSAVIVSGAWRMDLAEDLSPMSRMMFFFMKRAPILYQLWQSLLAQSLKGDPEKVLARFKNQLPPADYTALAQPNCMESIRKTKTETLRQGTKGAAHDIQLYTREWDFNFEEIQMPLIWFHGEQDRNIPIGLIKQTTESLTSTQLITYPQEGHISLIMNQFEAITDSLMGNSVSR